MRRTEATEQDEMSLEDEAYCDRIWYVSGGCGGLSDWLLMSDY